MSTKLIITNKDTLRLVLIKLTFALYHRAHRYETNATRVTWNRGNKDVRERESGQPRAKGTGGKAHWRLAMAEINNARWRRI
jgi:hypothetical protein